MSRPVFRLLTVAAAAAVAVGLTALPALAHVSVSSTDATQGGFGVLTFRMPNEVDNANATELKVQLPPDQPLASVAVKPQPGCAYTVSTAKLATPLTDDDGNKVTDYTSVIDWKATAGGIKPGEYAEFQLSVGPLPKADSMVFKAIQTYSDGKVVSWIEVPPAGSTTTTTASIAFISPGPRIATITIASSRLGSVRMMSISRMIAISKVPRKNPATRPSVMPTTIAIATTAMPISSDRRAP